MEAGESEVVESRCRAFAASLSYSYSYTQEEYCFLEIRMLFVLSLTESIRVERGKGVGRGG